MASHQPLPATTAPVEPVGQYNHPILPPGRSSSRLFSYHNFIGPGPPAFSSHSQQQPVGQYNPITLDDNQPPSSHSLSVIILPASSSHSLSVSNYLIPPASSSSSTTTTNTYVVVQQQQRTGIMYPPKKGDIKTKLCKHFKRGRCDYGDQCGFAHGVGDLQITKLPPNYRTRACKNISRRGGCEYGAHCNFYHPY